MSSELAKLDDNRYICHACRKEFEQTDFSDEIWKLFCCFGCLFTWCRGRMPKPMKAANSE
ncbi:MAG: hypothetical protein KGJ13_07970 [Patescibacteria group bacterium]|nr:hypothetical protein [Patescibacteria group bacterium]